MSSPVKRHQTRDKMDLHLEAVGLRRKSIPADGTCLFRAVAEQLFLAQSQHGLVRRACIHYLQRHHEQFEKSYRSCTNESFHDHLYHLENDTIYPGKLEIRALSDMYRCDFILFQEPGKPPVIPTDSAYTKEVTLCVSNHNHYDSVYPRRLMEDTALVQSILYELLYARVFKMEKPREQAVEMLSQKMPRIRKDSYRSSSPESGSPTSDDSGRRTGSPYNGDDKDLPTYPFPFRVARALDPTIYRNVELDTWIGTKKDQLQQHEQEAPVRPLFATGDKCQVYLDDAKDVLYNAHIQEIQEDKGPVTVFIEELGEKHTIPYANLKPLPQQYQQDALNGKKKLRRRKDQPAVIPFGRGQSLPPRLQPQQSENNMAVGRGNMTRGNGYNTGYYSCRSPFKHQSLINAAGHPTRGRWIARFPFGMRGGRGGHRGGFFKHHSCHCQPYMDFPPFASGHSNDNRVNGKVEQGDSHRHTSAAAAAAAEELSSYETSDRDGVFSPAPASQSDVEGACSPTQWQTLEAKMHHKTTDGDGGAVEHDEGPTQYSTGGSCCAYEATVGDPSMALQGRNNVIPSAVMVGGTSGEMMRSSHPGGEMDLHYGPPPPPPPPPNMPCGGAGAAPAGYTMLPQVPPYSVPYFPWMYITAPHMENCNTPINFNAMPSTDAMGSDLPHGDPGTLRFFYNLGIEYYRLSMMGQQQFGPYLNSPVYYSTSCYGNGMPPPPPPPPDANQMTPNKIAESPNTNGYISGMPASAGVTGAPTSTYVYPSPGYGASPAYIPAYPPPPVGPAAGQPQVSSTVVYSTPSVAYAPYPAQPVHY